MVKNLYVNETLFVSIQNNRLKPIIMTENNKKELDNNSYQFMQRYSHIMELLKNGSIIQSFRDNDTIKTIIGTIKSDDVYKRDEYLEKITESIGYTFEESIEKLEFSMYKPKPEVLKKLYKERIRYVEENK